MKYFTIILLSLTFLTGCVCKTYHVDKVTPLSEDECKNIPRIWWGEKGDDPSDNEVWKCYSWELHAR